MLYSEIKFFGKTSNGDLKILKFFIIICLLNYKTRINYMSKKKITLEFIMTVVDQLSFSKNALNQYAQKIGKLIDSEVANEEPCLTR